MKPSTIRCGKPGFVSYLLVLSAGAILLLMSLYAYREALASQQVASQVNLRVDYSEKEDAILRSIVALAPNRAIQAMKGGSSASASISEPLRWQNIFNESLDLANARTSVSDSLKSDLNIANVIVSNSGDSSLQSTDKIFGPISTDTSAYKSSYASAGINRLLGSGYPAPLESNHATILSSDAVYPLISDYKQYGTLAQADVQLPVSQYPKFNILSYPRINFGYAKPGDPFVAKRNWWAFSMELAGNDNASTSAAHLRRNFVLSIYEIPSQLAISASAFMSLGQYGSGGSWDSNKVSISGGVFLGKAVVEGSTALSSLASRRSMSLSSSSVIGGKSFSSDPFAPGVREAYQVTEGDFFPVSMASESGRVAFVPINRGADFFDRFSNEEETNSISPTTWNNYSSGALQCAMRLDITDTASVSNKTPTKLRFSYLKGGTRQDLNLNLQDGIYSGLPVGYLFACNEDQSYDFGTAVVDLAYGCNGTYAFENQATGIVTFSNARFGNPVVGVAKVGYYKPSYPFEIKQLSSGKICVAVYPQRFSQFLKSLGADDTSVNNSLVVNVDYSASTGSTNLVKPTIPCTDLDYGLILQECADLTSFTNGFSLVTNLRTYVGDDFNIVQATPPTGYTPASGVYYPPCSIFSPEKRYGVDVDPYAISLTGRVGSLASDSEVNPVRPLDSKSASGHAFAGDKITVNLSPITHPAELPPITMMNWLITLTEARLEFKDY